MYFPKPILEALQSRARRDDVSGDVLADRRVRAHPVEELLHARRQLSAPVLFTSVNVLRSVTGEPRPMFGLRS
jgi:hypothetical protein